MAQLMLEDYLELMEDVLEKAQNIPLSSKKALVDVEQLHDCIEKIRLNMPSEMKQANKLVQERKSIIDEANKQADMIITRAETRAKEMTDNSEITKAAQARAAEIEKQAVIKGRALKTATDEYITDMLSKAEETLSASITAIKRTKSTIKAPKPSNPNIPNN